MFNKYNAKRTVIDGESFPSRLEAAHYSMLKVRQAAGEIKNLSRKATVYFEELDLRYKADACYIDVASNEKIWTEAKGMVTDRWRLIRKIWVALGPGRLEVYKDAGRGQVKLTEVINSKKGACYELPSDHSVHHQQPADVD